MLGETAQLERVAANRERRGALRRSGRPGLDDVDDLAKDGRRLADLDEEGTQRREIDAARAVRRRPGRQPLDPIDIELEELALERGRELVELVGREVVVDLQIDLELTQILGHWIHPRVMFAGADATPARKARLSAGRQLLRDGPDRSVDLTPRPTRPEAAQ